MHLIVRVVGLVCRTLLVSTLGIASFLKWRDRSGTVQWMKEMALPERLHDLVATGLPIVEMALAILLIFRKTLRFGAICAALVFSLFTSLIGLQVHTGRQVPCPCFGKLSKEPAGRNAIARNLILIASSLLLSIVPDIDSTKKWQESLREVRRRHNLPRIFGLSMLLGQSLILIIVLKRYGQMLATSLADRTTSDPSRSVALEATLPGDFAVELDDGFRQTLKQLSSREGAMFLIFYSSGCADCVKTVSHLFSAGPEALTSRRKLTFISPDLEVFRGIDRADLPNAIVIRDDGNALRTLVGVPVIPSLIIASEDLKVLEPPFRGYGNIVRRLAI